MSSTSLLAYPDVEEGYLFYLHNACILTLDATLSWSVRRPVLIVGSLYVFAKGSIQSYHRLIDVHLFLLPSANTHGERNKTCRKKANKKILKEETKE